MFTGIVTAIGTIESLTALEQGKRFRVISEYDPEAIEIGASIAHAGVCLTVTAKGSADDRWYEVEAWEEALRLTTLGKLQTGDRINLEKSLKLGDELGGHLVQGHIDGMVEIVDVIKEGRAQRFVLEVSESLTRFIAPKGSVALDGTSLTVNAVIRDRFDVLLIGHTLEVTTWADRGKGDFVNIEIDQMARYAARLFETASTHFDG